MAKRRSDKAPRRTGSSRQGWKQGFTAYDDGAVRAFLDAHMDKCCESVP